MQLSPQKNANDFIGSVGFIGVVCLVLSSCSVMQKTAKKDLNNGYYTQYIGKLKQKVYIDVENETVYIYPTTIINNQLRIDTNTISKFYNREILLPYKQVTSFSKPSLDVDFLTIPLKYRTRQKDVPQQLNTNLNGAVYVGYRTDKYVLKYIENPKGKADRNINHVGFSLGVFTGLGNTFISPTTTYNNLQQEYDGIVWSKGFAGIVAVNNFTLGIALGFDNLIDNNKNIWIYQSKPWLGLAFGLNLN